MIIESINIEASIQTAKELIAKEKSLSPALKVALDVLLLLVTILANRLGLNSKNSSKPPSTDPNRKKKLKEPGDRKPGGQHGHIGTTLKQFPDPDEIKDVHLDRSTLPPGSYRITGYETRQVVDIDFSTFVTEWRAEVIEHQNGKRYVAQFPDDVTRPIQYGVGVKSTAVYMSQYQLIPYTVSRSSFRIRWVFPLVRAQSTISIRLLSSVLKHLNHGSKNN